MKHPRYLILPICFALSFLAQAQYTDVINSNRPGVSVSAYAVGKNVLQGEFGFVFERRDHKDLRLESTDFGGEFAIRYGLLVEELEVIWEGTFVNRDITDDSGLSPFTFSASDFLRHTIGAKYLIFDPYKNEESREPNLYSWNANNKFQWKDLIPAISIYAGANIIFPDNPLLSEDFFIPDNETISPRIGIAAQSHISGRWVVIGNIFYDQFTTDDPVLSYVFSVTHNLKNPKWSVFLENQGIDSDAFSDISLRGGAARLINKNFQVDASVGANFKNTPTRLFGTIGVSYRLDFHKDELIEVEKTIKKPRKKYKKKKEKRKNKGKENNPVKYR
ncbi:transporter [Flavobacteriaceae bacterium R38]|nr:transporter [Flavobacteriaceae bacterium R38]